MTDLEFTGERIVPGKVDDALWYEHMARYVFAADFVKDKIVLDAGCGSGYGTDFLASQGAKYILGVDISPEAIAYARAHYQQDNLEYRIMDVTAPEVGDKSFDAIIAFEVFEHLRDQKRFLAEMARVLRDDGLFVVSTPNREVYRLRLEPNPFHTREFNFEELHEILSQYFHSVEILAQDYLAGIAIEPVFGNRRKIEEITIDRSLIRDRARHLYFAALCSQAELGDLVHAHKLVHFSYDRDEYLGKLQAEFQERTEWAKRLDEELARRKEELPSLQEELAQTEKSIAHLQAELGDQRDRVQGLSEDLVRREKHLLRLQEELAHKDEHIAYLRGQLEHTRGIVEQGEQQVEALQQQVVALEEALVWPKIRRILRRPLWPLIGLYRLLRPFWKLRTPPECCVQRALIVGSAPKDSVLKVIDSLLRRFPHMQVTALVRDDLQDVLCSQWPQLEVRTINKAEYRRNPFRLLTKLWRLDFDLAVTVLSGGSGSYKHKSVGFLSGARYLMVYNENIDSFYWMLGQSHSILHHLRWRLRSGGLRLNPKYWLSFLLAPFGCIVVFVRVLPLLVRAICRRSPR